jgi:hypothetical protein
MTILHTKAVQSSKLIYWRCMEEWTTDTRLPVDNCVLVIPSIESTCDLLSHSQFVYLVD